MNDHTGQAPAAEHHGLTVEDVPRARYAGRRPIPAGSEPRDTGLTSDLRDLRTMPLDQMAEAFRAGEALLEPTLQRIQPDDGSRVLLVAASFNSAI